jgi:hypothetical protein
MQPTSRCAGVIDLAWAAPRIGQSHKSGDEVAYRPSRRQLIAGAGASALALTSNSFTQPPAMARGVVFEDRHGDGRRRAGNPGIPGVMVSNGRDVALTDIDGGWSLPVEPGGGIFVVKPPQWTIPTLLGSVPRFSYLHGERIHLLG